MVYQKHIEANFFIAYIRKQHRSKIPTITEYLLPNRKHRIIPLKNNPSGAVSTIWECMQLLDPRFAHWKLNCRTLLNVANKSETSAEYSTQGMQQSPNTKFSSSSKYNEMVFPNKISNKWVIPDGTIMHWDHPN